MESGIRHQLDVVILALCMLLATASGVQAQGLLLGAGDSTYYVAKRAGGWSVLRIPGYWVPRGDGFWTVRPEIPTHLFKEGEGEGEGEEGEGEIDYMSNDWCFAANMVAHRIGEQPRYAKQDERCTRDGHHSGDVQVTFLAPQYAGFDMVLVTDARSGYDKGSIFTWIDTLAQHGYANQFDPYLPQVRLLSDSALIENTWRKCKRLGDGEEEEYLLDDIGAGIVRVRGRWVYFTRQAGMATVSRGMPDGICHMPIDVPREVMGFDEVAFDWRNLPRDLKQVADTYVSPDGDVLGVLTRDGELAMYRLEAGVPRERLYATRVTANQWCGVQWEGDPGECASTVMVQWATGSHVQRWSRLLNQIRMSL